jgi:hypothetical protein
VRGLERSLNIGCQMGRFTVGRKGEGRTSYRFNPALTLPTFPL